VSICGELGGRPLEAMALLGLGYERFSLPSASIGPVKRMIRSASQAKLQAALSSLLSEAPANMRDAIHQIADAQGVKL
jgi:phosphotransferase system enzyme I (PtsP)